MLETARGGILREGLGFDRCDVAVVTNIAEGDHLGLADVDTPEQLARVKRTVVEAVAPGGAAVLRADCPAFLRAALSALPNGKFRAQVEEQLTRCLDGARHEANRSHATNLT